MGWEIYVLSEAERGNKSKKLGSVDIVVYVSQQYCLITVHNFWNEFPF